MSCAAAGTIPVSVAADSMRPSTPRTTLDAASAGSPPPTARARDAERAANAAVARASRHPLRHCRDARSRHGREALIRPQLATDLRARTAIHLDHVSSEVVLAAQQRGAHAVGIHRHAGGLEAGDALVIEAARDDDLHVRKAGGVELLAHGAN